MYKHNRERQGYFDYLEKFQQTMKQVVLENKKSSVNSSVTVNSLNQTETDNYENGISVHGNEYTVDSDISRDLGKRNNNRFMNISEL